MMIGTLGVFMESSLKLMDVWLAAYFVFAGTSSRSSSSRRRLERILEWLPFRYQIGFPVELITARYDLGGARRMLGAQWTYVPVSRCSRGDCGGRRSSASRRSEAR